MTRDIDDIEPLIGPIVPARNGTVVDPRQTNILDGDGRSLCESLLHIVGENISQLRDSGLAHVNSHMVLNHSRTLLSLESSGHTSLNTTAFSSGLTKKPPNMVSK